MRQHCACCGWRLATSSGPYAGVYCYPCGQATPDRTMSGRAALAVQTSMMATIDGVAQPTLPGIDLTMEDRLANS